MAGRSVLTLTGIAASGRHGANPGERDRPQDFVVNVEVEVEVAEDAIDATADYRAVADVVRGTVGRESFVLLETLAEAVAQAVLRLERAVRVTAVVHKPGAARSLGVEDVSAEAVAD